MRGSRLGAVDMMTKARPTITPGTLNPQRRIAAIARVTRESATSSGVRGNVVATTARGARTAGSRTTTSPPDGAISRTPERLPAPFPTTQRILAHEHGAAAAR